MHDPHVGEDAELYAIGLLDSRERAAVDAHIEGCLQCLRAVGSAEETVFALGFAPVVSPAKAVRLALPRSWIAIAAAFVIGLLPAVAILERQARDAGVGTRRNAAMVAMIESHFAHAQFVALVSGAPKAKVLYARNGSWLYVIVSGSKKYAVATSGGRTLGETDPIGNTSELWLPAPPPARALVLRDDKRALERAELRENSNR